MLRGFGPDQDGPHVLALIDPYEYMLDIVIQINVLDVV